MDYHNYHFKERDNVVGENNWKREKGREKRMLALDA